MYKMIISVALLLASNAAHAAYPTSTGSKIPEGSYSGRNQNRWFAKTCSLAIYRHKSSLVLVTADDGKFVYNLWMEGQEFQSADHGVGWLQTDRIFFDKKIIQNNTLLYSTLEKSGSSREFYSIDIDATDFGLLKGFTLNHTSEAGTINSIDCRKLSKRN